MWSTGHLQLHDKQGTATASSGQRARHSGIFFSAINHPPAPCCSSTQPRALAGKVHSGHQKVTWGAMGTSHGLHQTRSSSCSVENHKWVLLPWRTRGAEQVCLKETNRSKRIFLNQIWGQVWVIKKALIRSGTPPKNRPPCSLYVFAWPVLMQLLKNQDRLWFAQQPWAHLKWHRGTATEIAKYSEEGRGGGAEVPHPAQQGRVREGPLAWCPQLRHGSAQAKLLFKRFSWRHKGLLTSLMPPFNTELFRIPSRLCFYSEWQGTFPLGKLEKCFCFFFLSFFLFS